MVCRAAVPLVIGLSTMEYNREHEIEDQSIVFFLFFLIIGVV